MQKSVLTKGLKVRREQKLRENLEYSVYFGTARTAADVENTEIASFGFIPFHRRWYDFLEKVLSQEKESRSNTRTTQYSCPITILYNAPITAENKAQIRLCATNTIRSIVARSCESGGAPERFSIFLRKIFLRDTRF